MTCTSDRPPGDSGARKTTKRFVRRQIKRWQIVRGAHWRRRPLARATAIGEVTVESLTTRQAGQCSDAPDDTFVRVSPVSEKDTVIRILHLGAAWRGLLFGNTVIPSLDQQPSVRQQLAGDDEPGGGNRAWEGPPHKSRGSEPLSVVDRIQFQPAFVAGCIDVFDRAAHDGTGHTSGIPHDAPSETEGGAHEAASQRR